MECTIFIGPVVHSERKEELSCFNSAAIIVHDGKITGFDKSGDEVKLLQTYQGKGNIVKLKKGQFLCPGFVDAHVHAPQYPNIGLGCDLQLLEWLESYTLPLESRYKDVEFAERIYSYVVDSTLTCGSTTSCYYGTIHLESSVKLAEIASKKGQRAIVGKVNMNQNSVPGYLEDTKTSVDDTRMFIEKVIEIGNPLVEPAITPRFAISCDFELLTSLGNLLKEYDVYVQTHICESESEINFTKELFPNHNSYGQIYRDAGLLTKKTILGHGVFLSDEEKAMLSSAGSSVAHCGNSNILLKSGLCPVRDLWAAGVKVGLGTDVGGGSNLSILDSMRSALTVSTCISFNRPTYKPLTYHEAFYLATQGGADAISKGDIIGNFQIGKSFDALVVDMGVYSSPAGVLDTHTVSDLIQKFIYCGNESNIIEVYVNGKLVKKK